MSHTKKQQSQSDNSLIDPLQARFLRKQKAQQQQNLNNQYQQNNQHNQDDYQPNNKHNSHNTQKPYNNNNKSNNKNAGSNKYNNSLKNQLQYFGNKIQPFNMKQDDQLGNVDDDGFFVFKRGRQNRDAWLESIGEGNEEEIVDGMVKKIKETRFKSVYQSINQGRKRNNNNEGNGNNQQEENDQQQNENDNESYQGGGIQQVSQSKQQQDENQQFKLQQLVQLMIQNLPKNGKMNANNYMKTLKKQKKMQQYNRLLTISNIYIQKTGQYDILTKKKQELQNMLEQLFQKKREKNKLTHNQMQDNVQKQQDQIGGWDEDDDQYSEEQRKLQEKKVEQLKNKQHQNGEVSQDDISQEGDKSDDNDDDNIF